MLEEDPEADVPSDQEVLQRAEERRASKKPPDGQATSDTEPDPEAEPPGAGWLGEGEPLFVGSGARRR
eukprot:3952825-Lingulodinium_polyedra.AAC.1